MNNMEYYNDNNEDINEDIIENYYQPRNMNYPTYPMYSCPLCNYPMSMRDQYYDSYEYDDPDEYYDLDESDDPGYRQRRRRRRRRRRRHGHRHFDDRFFFPSPFFFPFFF